MSENSRESFSAHKFMRPPPNIPKEFSEFNGKFLTFYTLFTAENALWYFFQLQVAGSFLFSLYFLFSFSPKREVDDTRQNPLA
jgi:hypothetical protein